MNSESIKKSYTDCHNAYIESMKKLDKALTLLTHDKYKMEDVDKLLDLYNYTKFAYSVNKMNYCACFIVLYMNENNIVNNNKVPVNTSLKLLLEQDWIDKEEKDFLSKYLIRSLNGEDFTKYTTSIDNYIDFIINHK